MIEAIFDNIFCAVCRVGVEKGARIVYNRGMERKRNVFMCRLPVINYVILGVMCAVLVPFAVLGILRLLEVGEMYAINPALEIAAIIAEVVATTVVILFTALSRYIVTPDYFAFQRILTTKIPVERLLLLRHETTDNMLVLYYADDQAPEGVRFVVVRVSVRAIPRVVEAIQEVNPRVGYEMFDATRQKDE